jgi:uncharacterized membrane protein
MNDKLQNWYKVTILSYVSLILTLIVWYFIISPPQFTLSFIFTLAYIAILLLPAPKLIKKSTGVYMWSSYLILIYFAHAIIETWANADERILALLELVFSSVYFIAATLCYRYARQKDKQQTS